MVEGSMVQEASLKKTVPEVDDGRLAVRLVQDHADLASVRTLRASKSTGQVWFDPDADILSDAASYVWLAERDRKIVATGRALPHDSGLDYFSRSASAAPVQLDGSWVEMGRWVVDGPGGHTVAQLLFRELATWLLHNTRYRKFYGMCVPDVAAYYRGFGITVLTEPIIGRWSGQDLLFVVFTGDFEELQAKWARL